MTFQFNHSIKAQAVRCDRREHLSSCSLGGATGKIHAIRRQRRSIGFRRCAVVVAEVEAF